MKLTVATSAAAVALVALGFAAVAEVARHPVAAPTRVAMDADVKPVSGHPGQFLLTSRVVDLESHAVLAHPRMVIAAGRTAHLQLSGRGGWVLRLGIAADGATRKAEYDATFSRAAKVLSRQRLTLDLNG